MHPHLFTFDCRLGYTAKPTRHFMLKKMFARVIRFLVLSTLVYVFVESVSCPV